MPLSFCLSLSLSLSLSLLSSDCPQLVVWTGVLDLDLNPSIFSSQLRKAPLNVQTTGLQTTSICLPLHAWIPPDL